MASHAVARVDEIPPGARKLVDVAGRRIGVFNVDGEFFALLDRCPHQGGPLCAGQLLGTISSPGPGAYEHGAGVVIRCPWHAWEFDLRTGRSWVDPQRTRVKAYPTGVRSGRALAADRVPGALTAETVAVRVEADYVVVDVGRS